jgi:hypothetical protein
MRANLSTVTETDEISDHRFTYKSDLVSPSVDNTFFAWDGSEHTMHMGVLTDDWNFGNVAGYEALTWDFNPTTDNEVAVSSPSGVTDINFGTINLVTTGTITGALSTITTWGSPTTANPYTLTAANSYGAVLYYGATGEIDLPAVADGMSALIVNTGAFTITIDPNASEVIVREGTAQTGGVSITLSSGAGNYVALVSDGVNWQTMGFKGTLAQGS